METQELNDLLGEKIIEAIKDENMPMDRKFSRVEHLYNLGANLNVCDDKGHTPLEFSILNGYKEIAKFLIEKGADANEKYYYKGGWYFLTALIWASKGGYKEIVELLVEKGVDVDAKDDSGETALMKASEYGYKEIIELLIEKEADINAEAEYGWTALMFASMKGHKEIAEFLIEKGADVNAKDRYGQTALTFASRCGDKEIVELLEKARKESKAKLKEELKEDSKFLRGSKDKKSNTNGGFWNRIFGGNDGM